MHFRGRVYLLPDFNKPHRCPGWSGPGFVCRDKYDTGCHNGCIHIIDLTDERGEHPYVWDFPWRFGTCEECGVRTFPYALRWFNWRWLHHVLIWKNKIRFGNWWDEVQYVHGWGRFAPPTVLDVLQPKEDSEEGTK